MIVGASGDVEMCSRESGGDHEAVEMETLPEQMSLDELIRAQHEKALKRDRVKKGVKCVPEYFISIVPLTFPG
jgi:hypothetical protein